MKIEKEQIEVISTLFTKMRSKEDLLVLLNEAKKFLYGQNCSPITLKSLSYYANPSLSSRRLNLQQKTGQKVKLHF
jgi:RNA-directed DNA polymerase